MTRPLRSQLYHSVALPLLDKSGLFSALRWVQRRSALILMYHNIVEVNGSNGNLTNQNQVTTTSFRWQLEFLREHYTVVPLVDIVERLKSSRSIERLAAITFDDGYAGVYANAEPILRAMGLPSTVFLIAGCIEDNAITWFDQVEALILNTSHRELTLGGVTYDLCGDRLEAVRAVKQRLKPLALDVRDAMIAELAENTDPLAPDRYAPYRLMGWKQIEELRSQGMSFGVHTYTHPHLSRVPKEKLQFEVDHAAEVISERLSMPLRELVFCYPDGDYTEPIRDYIEESGMLAAVAVDNSLARPSTDLFAIPRIAVGRGFSPAAFSDATVGFTRGLKESLRTQ